MGNNIKFKEEDNTGELLVGSKYTIHAKPEYVGGYDWAGGNGKENSIVFNFVKKPNWFHRTCTRFFLGWRWNDEELKKDKKNLLLG